MEYLTLPVKTVFDVKWTNVQKSNSTFIQKQHTNPNYQLIAVTEGPLFLQIEQEKLTLQSGDIVILFPWELHKGWKPEAKAGEFFWVQFQSSKPMVKITEQQLKEDLDKNIVELNLLRTERASQSDFLILPYRTIHITQKYKLLRVFEELMTEFHQMNTHYLYRCSLLLGSMLEMTATELLNQKPSLQPASQSHRIFRKTISLLHNFFWEEIDKTTIETQVDRNYQYVGQVFKKYSGITIGEYHQYLRIQRTKHLLLHTEKSIKDISTLVGFDDPYYFSKVFKKMEGISPTKFRQSNQK